MKKSKCYIYTRVSTSMQVDGYSLDAQKEKLRKYAEFQEMSIVGEYSDEGKSGKNVEGRTDFVRMLNDIQMENISPNTAKKETECFISNEQCQNHIYAYQNWHEREIPRLSEYIADISTYFNLFVNRIICG